MEVKVPGPLDPTLWCHCGLVELSEKAHSSCQRPAPQPPFLVLETVPVGLRLVTAPAVVSHMVYILPGVSLNPA